MSSLVKSSILVSILTLVSSVISFLNQVIIASNFGTGHDMDTYLLITSFPFLISGVISSAFSFSLIPHFVSKPYNYFKLFLKTVVGYSFLLLIFFWSLYHFFLIKYFELEHFPKINLLNLIVWLVFFCTIIFNVISCYFTSKSKFVLPVILNFFPFIYSILSVSLYNYIGVSSIVMGLLVGYVIAILISIIVFLKKDISVFEIKKSKSDVFSYLKSMKFTILAMLTFSVFQIVDAFWGKRLGESAISYLGYSQRIIIAIGALVISGPSAVLIPRLKNAYSNGNLEDYYKDSSMVIKLVFALTSFAAIIGSFFSYDIVKIMFQRGNFNEESTKNVAGILPYMLLGMTFMLSVVISFRSLFVQKISFKTSLLGVFTFTIYFILSGIFSKYFYIKGIAIAYILTWIIIFIGTQKILFKTSFKYYLEDFVLFLLKQVILLSVILLVAYSLTYLENTIIVENKSNLIFILFKISIISGICLIIYLFLAIKILKQKELIILFSKMPILNKWIA